MTDIFCTNSSLLPLTTMDLKSDDSQAMEFEAGFAAPANQAASNSNGMLTDESLDLLLGLPLGGDALPEGGDMSVFAFDFSQPMSAVSPGSTDSDSGHCTDESSNSGSVSPLLPTLEPHHGRPTSRSRTGKVTSRSTADITAQEREMLESEGIHLPEDTMSLTKSEERALKRIRRKIKNKLSAQDSRRRKKEYVQGLEDRVEKCTQINMGLKQKVSALETENKTLLQQLRELQQVVARRASGAGGKSGTALMILALSFSLMWNPMSKADSTAMPSSFQSRTLKSEAVQPNWFMDTIRDVLPTLSTDDSIKDSFPNLDGMENLDSTTLARTLLRQLSDEHNKSDSSDFAVPVSGRSAKRRRVCRDSESDDEDSSCTNDIQGSESATSVTVENDQPEMIAA